MVGLAFYLLTVDDRTGTDVIVAVVFVLLGALGVAIVARARITVTPNQVSYRNLFRTFVIDKREVLAVDAGYWGITIETRDRREPLSHCAIAVQKSNAASATGIRTRADDVVDAIKANSPIDPIDPPR